MKITNDKSNKNKINKENVVISGEEYTKPDKPVYVCNFCNRTLGKLSDNTFWCNNCNIEFRPEEVRKKQRLQVPQGQDKETLVATTPDPVSQFEHKPPELKGTFAELQKRGIKIKDYRETDGAGRTIT